MPDDAPALGFDYGKRRVGVAVGSPVTGRAQPLITLRHRDGLPDWSVLDGLVGEWRPSALVVGLPLTADGAVQEMTRRARLFAAALRDRYRLHVATMDERYSTIEAAERLREARSSGSRGRRLAKGDIDAMAAQTILEGWLSSQGEHAR